MSSISRVEALLIDHPVMPVPRWGGVSKETRRIAALYPDLPAGSALSRLPRNEREILAAQGLAAVALCCEFDLWPGKRAILHSRIRRVADGVQLVFSRFPMDLRTVYRRIGNMGLAMELCRKDTVESLMKLLSLPREFFQPEGGHGFFLDRILQKVLKNLPRPLDPVTARNLWAYRWEVPATPDSGELLYWALSRELSFRVGGAMYVSACKRGLRSRLLRTPGPVEIHEDLDELIICGEFSESVLESAELFADSGNRSLVLIGVFPPGWNPPGLPLGLKSPLSEKLAIVGVGLDRARREVATRNGRFDPRYEADRRALTRSAMWLFEEEQRKNRRGRRPDLLHQLLSLSSRGLPEKFLLGFDGLSAGDLAQKAGQGGTVRDVRGWWRLPRPPRLRPDIRHAGIAPLFQDETGRYLLHCALASAAGEAEEAIEKNACRKLQLWTRERLDSLETKKVRELFLSLDHGVLGPEIESLRIEAAMAELDLAGARLILNGIGPHEKPFWEAWIALEDTDPEQVNPGDFGKCLEYCPRIVAEFALQALRKPERSLLTGDMRAEELLRLAMKGFHGRLRAYYEILERAARDPESLFDEDWAGSVVKDSPLLEANLEHKRALALGRKGRWKEAAEKLRRLNRPERSPGKLGMIYLDLAAVSSGEAEEMRFLLRSLRLLEAAGYEHRVRTVLFNIAMNDLEGLMVARAAVAAWLQGIQALFDGDFEKAGDFLGQGGEDAEPWLAVLLALQGRDYPESCGWDPWGVRETADIIAAIRQFGFGRVDSGDVVLDGAPGIAFRMALVDFLIRDRSWITEEFRNHLEKALAGWDMAGWATQVGKDDAKADEKLHLALARLVEGNPPASLAELEQQSILQGLGIQGLAAIDAHSGKEVFRWGVGDTVAQIPCDPFILRILGPDFRMKGSVRLFLAVLQLIDEGAHECLQVGDELKGIIGESPGMIDLRREILRVAPSGLTVLIQGETGVGKELAAQAIHRNSQRSGPLVTVNLAAIADTLFVSELFGSVKGAYTGSDRDRSGLIAEAEGGTLFLDEIGDLAIGNQVKLLRFLESGEIRPIGSERSRKVDVRVLAATHRNLEQMVEKGVFREDLYYRILSARIQIPALRDRGRDVLLLRDVFARRAIREHGLSPARWSAEADSALLRHSWKGNVRELRRAVEYALLTAQGARIRPEHLPFETEGALRAVRRWEEAHRLLKIELLEGALDRSGGNQAAAARELGLSRQTLLYHIRKLGIAVQ